MKIFNFCFFILFLLSSHLVAQDDEIAEGSFDFLNRSDSSKVEKRFRVKEPISLLGFNSFLFEETGLDVPAEFSYLELRQVRSLQWGLGVVDARLGLNGTNKAQKLGLLAGLRLNISYYNFENDFQLVAGADTFQNAVVDVTKEVKNHKLIGTYLSIPLMIDFVANPYTPMKTVRFSVGYVHSFLLRGKYKLKYEDKEKIKIRKEDFNLNPSLGKLEARIGYGPVVLYVQYGLDGLFVKDRGPNVTPVSIGIVTGG